MSLTVVRIFCTEPFHSEVRFEEIHGKAILNVLGRAYEGFLARGEGAQIIKALSKLGKDDNEGKILCAPKLANYLLRVVTERLAHFTYKMNQTNDKVENQRWGKNGLKLTDDMLNNSTAHEEVYRLSQLLSVLTLASHHYADVHFVREDWDAAMNIPADAELEESEEETEDDEVVLPCAPLNEMPTSQRRTLADAKSMVGLIQTRVRKSSSIEQTRFIPIECFLEGNELSNWENQPDKTLLINSLQAALAGSGKDETRTFPYLRNMTFAEFHSTNPPYPANMFAVEQPSGNTIMKIVELILERARNACPLKVQTFVRIENFMTADEQTIYSPLDRPKIHKQLLERLADIWGEEDDISTFWNSCSLRGLNNDECQQVGQSNFYGAWLMLDQLKEVAQDAGEVNPWPANDPAV